MPLSHPTWAARTMTMPELLRSRTLTARKPHSCDTCGAIAVQPGQVYQRDTYAYDGRVYDWVVCAACAEITSRVLGWAFTEDGIGAEHYLEWAEEHETSDADAAAYLRRRR